MIAVGISADRQLPNHIPHSSTSSIDKLRLGRFDLFADIAQPRIDLAASGFALGTSWTGNVHRMSTCNRVGVVTYVVLVHPVVSLFVLGVLYHGASDRYGSIHHDLREVADIFSVQCRRRSNKVNKSLGHLPDIIRLIFTEDLVPKVDRS